MPDQLDRDHLPIPDRPYAGPVYEDARDPDAKFPTIEPLRPPAGAPNVLIVLLDDVGFAASSAFGGPCATPTAERLAAGGLKLNRFHTTALCSPTRQALLTGRNHHTVGMGGITEIATSAPGYNSIRPNTCAPLAETLKLNGYSTAQFGKCHEVPVWETSPTGPFDAWPTGGGGFEYFYGFIGGETNQYYPGIYEGTTPVEQPKTPEEGYHFTEDMTDKAIGWIRQQKALTPDKPFFVVLRAGRDPCPPPRPGGVVGQVQRQVRPGLGRPARGDPRPAEGAGRRPAGDRADPAARGDPRLGRHAGRAQARARPADGGLRRLPRAHRPPHRTTHRRARGPRHPRGHARLLHHRRQRGERRGHAQRHVQRELHLQRRGPTRDARVHGRREIDKFGDPEAYNHFAVGWAHAMDTPYQWTKQVASHWGGTRNGTIVHWPRGFSAKGEVRHQFHHVIDIAPTVLEAAGIPEPTSVNGVTQKPMEGVSMRYAFDDAERRRAAHRRSTSRCSATAASTTTAGRP